MTDTIENYHKIIIEIEDYAFLLLDDKGIITDWNKGAEKLKGYTADEAIGQSFRIFYTKEDCRRKQPEKLIKKAKLEGKAIDEGWRVRKDGSMFWGSILIKALYNDNNTVYGFLKITRDLTSRKQLEDQLRSQNDNLQLSVNERTKKLAMSETQLRHTLDNMLEGAQIHSFDWRYIYVNETLVKYSRYSREELMGYTIMEKYPGIEKSELFTHMKDCMTNRTSHRLETDFLFPDGSIAYFELSIQPVPEGIFILSVDATERKRAEEKLQKTIQELSAYKFAIDESAIVALTDPQGIIKHVNKNFCTISKYSEAELLGQDHRIVNSSFHPKEYIHDLWATISKGEIWKGELKNKAKDGTYYWVATTIVPFLNDKGEPDQYMAIRSDITKRKKIEEDLIKSNRLYSFLSAVNQSIVHTKKEQELFDRVCAIVVGIGQFKLGWIGMLDDHDRVIIMSAAGDDQATQLIRKLSGSDFYNPRLRHTHNGRMFSTGKYALVNDIQNDPTMLLWRQEMIDQGIKSAISLPITKFKKIVGVFSLSSGIQNFFDQEEMSLLKEAGDDISFALELFEKEKQRTESENKIRELNEQLENKVKARTADLTSAHQAMESFSYSVSHDLRTPVRAITGFANIIQEEYASSFDPELTRLFETIVQNGKRMNTLIDDMLTLARYDRQPLILECIDMSALCRKVSESISLIHPHRAMVKIGDLPNAVGDISMIEQVIVNLFSNAIKYSSKREKPLIEITHEYKGDMVVYIVRDNGAGFDMTYYDKLFGPFQRLHSSRDFEGTGVGLSLVKKIIEKHDGSVWADAVVDEGASFYFTLPAAQSNNCKPQ